MGAIQEVSQSVERIHELAQEMDLDDPSQQERLREIIREERTRADRGAAFGQVEKLFAQTLRNAAQNVLHTAEEQVGRHLGGRYRIAAPQTDAIPNLERLLQFFDGDELAQRNQFEEQVREMMAASRPVTQLNQEKFGRRVDEAVDDLSRYMETQLGRHGDDNT